MMLLTITMTPHLTMKKRFRRNEASSVNSAVPTILGNGGVRHKQLLALSYRKTDPQRTARTRADGAHWPCAEDVPTSGENMPFSTRKSKKSPRRLQLREAGRPNEKLTRNSSGQFLKHIKCREIHSHPRQWMRSIRLVSRYPKTSYNPRSRPRKKARWTKTPVMLSQTLFRKRRSWLKNHKNHLQSSRILLKSRFIRVPCAVSLMFLVKSCLSAETAGFTSMALATVLGRRRIPSHGFVTCVGTITISRFRPPTSACCVRSNILLKNSWSL